MTSNRSSRNEGGRNSTEPLKSGLGQSDPALIAVLPGMDTQPRIESPALVAERFRLALEKKRLERKLDEIDAILKAKTGERQVGDYLVNVSSFTVERVDTAAVKLLLGDDCPMTKTASLRLTVVAA